MKAYWRSGGISPLILDPGIRWMWVVSFTPRPLYPHGKSPWYPLDRRLGGPQNQSRRGFEEKNSQIMLGLEAPIIQPRSPVIYHWAISNNVPELRLHPHALLLADHTCNVQWWCVCVNCKFERMWKETVVACFTLTVPTCLDEVRKPRFEPGTSLY
jgi:hypothetical protein